MKTYKIYIYKIIAIIALALLISSCSEDFLQKDATGLVSQEQLIKNKKWNSGILFGQVNGIIATSFSSGTGGTDGHDDFGQKSVDIATDLMSGNLIMSADKYGWFTDDAKLLNSTTTKSRAYMIWRYYYRLIGAANTVFGIFKTDSEIPEGDNDRVYFGQAKFLRAYAYFYLINLYAKPYDVSANDLSIPIVRSTEIVARPPSKVSDVYDFIINDLQDALTCLDGYTRSTIDEPDIYLTKGMLAYVYLAKGDYTNAAKYSGEVIDEGNFPLLTYDELTTTGFNNVSSPNWIWGIDLTKDNTAALPTFWGQCDYFTYSYCYAGAYKEVPINLYASIPSTDGRKSWFRNKKPFLGWNKFYDNGRKAGGDKLWENDEVYMRVEEMYLINAEANARANKLDDAKTILKTFLDERDPTVSATVDDMEQSELLDALFYNWNVEMWEEGRGLMTLKRFKQSVTRGDNDFAYPGETFKYDDARFTFEIPEAEINNNPYLRNK